LKILFSMAALYRKRGAISRWNSLSFGHKPSAHAMAGPREICTALKKLV
jgi:hypothetical protein